MQNSLKLTQTDVRGKAETDKWEGKTEHRKGIEMRYEPELDEGERQK